MSAHEWLEQAAPYALGALGDDERRSFETHLDGCEACRREVREMSEVARLLALAEAGQAPPPSLRERILAEARQVRPLASRTTAASNGAATAAPVGVSGSAASSAPSPSVTARPAAAGLTAKRRGMARVVVPWLAAAASIALAAVLGLRYRDLRDANTRVASMVEQLRADLGRRDAMIEALLAPDVHTVALTATGQPPSARLFWNRGSNQIILAAFSLPPAPSGRTYQLWGIQGKNAPVSLGTFNTGANGRGVVTLQAPPGAAMDVAAVTEEPNGGSPQPTSAPFLTASLKTD